MHRWRSLGGVALAVLVLAGCDEPPLGGTPLSRPARSWFASCPRLDGTYALVDRPEAGRYPWDKLTIRSDGDWAVRFTWRRTDLTYTNADLGADAAQLSQYRWSRGPDELADDDFLEQLAAARGLEAHSHTLVVRRKDALCEHGWLAVPQGPGSPLWVAGLNRSAQFALDRQGALLADFSVRVANHPYFTPSRLWCGQWCRDKLSDAHDVHAWMRAPRTLADGRVPEGLASPYDSGQDMAGGAAAAGDDLRERWLGRLQATHAFGATLTQVRVAGLHVEMSFAAHDSAGLVSAPAAMRHVAGLGNVRVHRFSGTTASPQTLTVTADADPTLIAALR